MASGRGWQRKGSYCLMETELFQLEKMEKSWEWMVAMVTQHCERINTTERYAENMVKTLNLMLWMFCHDKITQILNKLQVSTSPSKWTLRLRQ